MAKSRGLELGDNIYGQYRSIFNHRDVFGQQRNRVHLQCEDVFALFGHRGVVLQLTNNESETEKTAKRQQKTKPKVMKKETKTKNFVCRKALMM